MSNGLFITMLALFVTPLLFLAYKILPGERWQILATIPSSKMGSDSKNSWNGSNVTFYGILLATGGLIGTVVFAFLLFSAGITLQAVTILSTAIMLIAVVSAKVIARIVEKKRNTLTVAGGATVGLYLMPFAIWLYNHIFFIQQPPISLMPVMAALATGYIIGEGIGRLACISFGCCYGKPLHEMDILARKIFSPIACSYLGDTKKIVYASGLAGVKVVPIQAITSFLYVQTGLAGMYLYLNGEFALSFALTSIFALAWRIFSEKLRADYRGEGKISAYQLMGLINIFFCVILLMITPQTISGNLDFFQGLHTLWNPAAVIFFQILWMMLFLFTGLSKVTGASISFHVRKENI